jgi:hypothetical protein
MCCTCGHVCTECVTSCEAMSCRMYNMHFKGLPWTGRMQAAAAQHLAILQ